MSTSDLVAAFESNPSDHRAFEALIKQLMDDGDRATLESVLQRLPELVPDGADGVAFRVLSQLARTTDDDEWSTFLSYWNGMLLWKHYGDAQKAEMAFRKIKTPPPDPAALREFYLQFYVEQQNWRRLEQFLTDPTKGGMDDALEVKRMLGRLAEEKEQPDRAITFWQGVLSELPGDPEAEDALSRLYEQVGKWHAMVDLLKDRLKRVDGGLEQQLAIHRRMIDIYKEQLNAPTKVVGAWQSILELDAGNAEALDALASEYEEMKRWPDLVKVLQQKIEHADDTDTQIALHRRIANIMLDKFNNSSEAIKHYEAILELDPSNRESIDVLKEIYEQRRDYDSYILVAEREIGLAEDPAERQERYLQLARLASERIRKPATPIALWERVLEGQSDHPEALTELETLYEREKAYDRLAEIQERRVDLVDDPEEKVALLEKLGLVYTTRMDDPDKAAEVWKRLLALDPEHRKAQAELRKKYLAEQDWEGLEWFFRSYGTPAEWVRTLESQAKSIEDPEQQTELLFKAARLWQEELDDQRRAVKNLESVLEIAPTHAEAAGMLVPIYRELEQWRKLPPVYDIVLSATEDAQERRRLLLEQAAIHEDKLGDDESAFFAFVQAVSESPGSVELHPDLRRLAERSGNWGTYVSVLEEAVDLIEDEQARIGVLLDAGRVYRDQIQEPEAALTAFTRVIELDDQNRDALDAIEVLYGQMEAWDQLISVYVKKLKIARDGDERKEILFRLARVWRDRLQSNDEAEAIYREMLDDFPDDIRVHDALVTIYLEETRYEPMLDVLERKRDILSAATASGTVLADLECQLGMLTFGTRSGAGAVSAAVDHYAAALEHDPTHQEAVTRVEELLADAGQRLRIARILEPIYDAREQWRELAESLEIQLIAAADDGAPGPQVALLERLTELYREALDDKDLAWRSYARHFQLEPHRKEVREALEGLTGGLDRWQPMVALYTELADEPADPATRLAIKLAIARAWQNKLHDLEQARTFYHKVLDEEPENREAVDRLEEIYVGLDRAEDLLDIFRRKVELSSDVEQKLDYLFRISDLLRDGLERYDDAVLAAREALDLVPGHLDAMQRLDELFTRTERFAELAQVIEEMLTVVASDPERRTVLLVRLAGIEEAELQNVERAIGIYEQVLDVDGANLQAVAALERLFADEALAPQIAPILEPYYDRQGDWQRLIQVYGVREAHADLVGEKVEWHYKIADLYEHFGEQPARAFDHYVMAADLDPGSERTLGKLMRLSSMLGNHGELVVHLQRLVDEIDDDHRRKETHRIIAELARDRTHDIATSEKHLRSILEIDPADEAAIDGLIDLYRQTDATDKLVETMLSKAPMVLDGSAQRALYAEAGELAAGPLDDPARAIEIYQTLHTLDPAGGAALDALEVLYERVEAWDELVDVYRQKIERTDDIEEKSRYAALMGNVQADRQESIDDAVHTWRTILEWDPNALHALDQLDQLYIRQEDWYSLREILLRKQELVDDTGWVDAQYRLAQLYGADDRLADVRQGIEAYRALLGRRPDHDASVTALENIIRDRDERELAFAVLKPVLESREAYEDLWRQYEVIAKHQVDEPFRLITTLHAMADLAEGPLGDPQRAFEACARAFRADARHEENIIRLEMLAEEHGMLEELVALYEQGAADADDPILALQLRLKTGSLLMDRLAAPVRAIEVYKAVLEDNPDHKLALERLHRLYESQGQAAELAEILRLQADIHMDADQKIAFLARLAEVAEQELDDPNAAYEAYIEILDLDRLSDLAVGELWRLYVQGVQRVEIAYRLEPIYSEREQWDDLHALLELKLEAVSEAADRMDIMRQLALLNLERLGRKPEAIQWFGRAFRLDPEDDFLLQQLTDLSTEAGRWEDLRAILMDAASVVEDEQRKVELWHRAAAVSRDQLGDTAEAERVYRLILDTDGENHRALQAVDALLVQQQRWEDLEPVLAAEANTAEFDDERLVLLMRLAELYRDRLGRSEEAVAAYRRVLDINDMHRPALEALEVVYRRDGQHEALYEILQQLADTAPSDEARVARLGDMAEIVEVHLGEPEKAVELWEEVLALSPDDRHGVHQLQRLLEAQQSWDALVDAYDRELRMGVEDPARRLDLHKRLGRVLMTRLDDPFRAQGWWQKAREEEPYDQEALEALRGTYRDAFNLEGLVEVLEAQLQSNHYDQEAELAIWRELAEIRTEQLVDAPRAIEAWTSVLELAPGDHHAVESLERLYEQEERWGDAVALQRQKLSHTDDPETRVENWLHVATLQHQRLGDAVAAAETYKEILAAYPGQMEASQRLEAIYEGAGDFPSLAEVLLERTDHLSDVGERVMNLQRLARVYEQQIEAPENAFFVLQRASEEMPDDPATLAELARLAEVTGLWEEMLGVYDATLPQVEGDTALEVMLAAADVVRNKLHRTDEAVAYYGRVLEAEPESEVALRALVELNEELERWEPLVVALERLAEVTSDYSEKTTLLMRSAEVLENHIGDIDRAVEAWYAVLEVDEVDRKGLSALQRLHTQRREWARLIDILERTSRIEPQRAVELNLRIADIYEANLGKPEEAIERYEEVLNFEPGNELALQRLEALYGENDNWAKLIEVYERSYDSAQTDAERVTVAGKVALLQLAVYEDNEAAADWFHRILTMAPGHEEATTNLEQIYRSTKAWDDLIQLFELERGSAETAEGRAAALMQVGDVYRVELDDIDNAIGAYERVLHEDPSHRQALDLLEGLYSEQGLWEQVLDVIDRKLGVETEREMRLELLCRQGRIASEELANPDAAARYYDRALEESPGYTPAEDALVAIYTSEERFDMVVDTLNRKLAAADDPIVRSRVHIDLAEVWRERLYNGEKALEHLELAVEADPESESALAPLADYYMSNEQWTKAMPLLDVLSDRLEGSDDVARRGDVHRRLAMCAEALLDDERALDEYRRALAILPGNVDVLLGLSRLHFKRERWDEAERHLAELVRLHGKTLPDDTFLEVHLRLGEAALRSGNFVEAKRVLARVVEQQPGNIGAIASIVEVLEAHGDWEEAIDYKGRQLALLDDPLERFTVQMGIGDIWMEHLHDPQRAADAYEKALEFGRFSKGPILQLIQLHAREKNFTQAIRWLNELIDAEEDPAKKAHYAMSVAVMYRDEIGDNEEAVRHFNLVLDYDLEKLEAFRAVDELVTRMKDWKLLEQNYRRMIQRVQQAGAAFEKGPALLFTLYKHLGEIYRSRLKNVEYALSAFELASGQRPQDESIREILVSLYEVTADHLDKAVEQHRYLIINHPDRFESYHRIFRVFKKMGQGDRAWCVAGLLCALDKAEAEERKFYDAFVEPVPADPRRGLDQKLWLRWIMATQEFPTLGQTFALLYQTMGETAVFKSLKELGLKKKDRDDLTQPTLINTTMKNASQLLGIPLPEIYLGRQGLEVLPTLPPALAVGPDMQVGQSEKELAFRVGKRLTYFHPWRIMAALYDHAQLDLIYMAALKLVDPSFDIAARSDLPAETQQQIAQSVQDIFQDLERKATQQMRNQLAQVLSDFLSKHRAPKIGRWHREVELTANHAGLFLCGDIELVGKILSKEVSGASKLSRGDKLKDLVEYVLSDRYAEMRKQMGVEIDYSELLG
ncbi:MAG: tetratricopeptide repeat protein [Deltaproteobacteria bacterium]|nr:tetratricopeptide repeat protein [Deltaproteobacteria bacterium]